MRQKALALRCDIIRLTGEPTIEDRAMETAAPALFVASKLARRLGVLQQPGLLRTEHRTGAPTESTSKIFALQGGTHNGMPARSSRT